MKNLKVSWEAWSALDLQLGNEEEFIRLSAIDIERNRLFFASSNNFVYATQLPSPQIEGASSMTVLPALFQLIDLEAGDFITCLQYLMEKEALIIGTAHGLLLLYTVDEISVEIVGQLEGGVTCISPSPDGDLLGLVTGFGQILMMNLDWDILYEMPLSDSPEEVDVNESTISADYSSEIPLSWRGDGKYFASLSKVHGCLPLCKNLKVWERDSGTLHSASEPKSFMGSVLDWTGSGAKIAVVYDKKDEMQCPSVVLFEKNGLERSSFSINEGVDVTVDSLKFNCNSDVLAAVIRSESFDTLKIWFFSNNHWYLKQEIRYSKEDGVKFMWDPTKALKLISWTLDGRIVTYKFIWVPAVVDNSIAFVIDGSKILVTPFSLTLIPPPMYFLTLEFPTAIRDLAFCSKVSQNHLAASLSDGSLCIVELPLLDQWDDMEGMAFKIEALYSGADYGSLVHLAWLDSHVLLSVSHFGFNNVNCTNRTPIDKDVRCPGYYLQEIGIRCSENHISGSVTGSGWHAEVSNQIYLEGKVIGIAPNPSSRYSAFVQLEGGKLYEYMSKSSLNRGVSLQRRDGLDFLASCSWMDIATVGVNASDKPLLFGLDDNGRLHLERKILCNNCSSYSFYSNSGDNVTTHLVIATKQDLLFIVDVGDIVHGQLQQKYENFMPIIVKNKKGENESRFINIWEKGAQIVGVLHGDESAIILQPPRGNIECVYPRKLVLSSIFNALAQGRFKDALFMVRQHRIDFNVIVDHYGCQAFIESAADFVEQVNNLGYVTEFVCALKNDDIMETLYRNYTSLPCTKGDKRYRELNGTDGSNKVSRVLLAIRKALEDHMEETPARELCILTALAKSNPPDLEEALRRIKVIRELELSRAADPQRASYPSSEESLKHLLWLSDSEAVFEAALGLYDLNLAAIVALNSQKDPKEFLPLLQEFERMPTLLMQYNIDLKLRRYESALRHIVTAGNAYYEDCMNLMKKVPDLYPLGLQLIVDPNKRRQVLEGWGDHLCSTKFFEDAATTFLGCFCLEKSLKAYRACGNWKGVLTVAGLIKLGKDDLLQLARELSEELQAIGKPGDAAKIVLEYCGDVETGISLLVDARNWEEALRIAFLHRRDDLILVVKNASLECACTLDGEYNEGIEKVGKYSARYLAVRQRRLLLAATIQSNEQSMGYLDDDTSSQASSNFSGMSAYTTGTKRGSSASTTASTRGRGRQRNRGKIRAGSADEEMALVEHLKGMSLTEGAKWELKSLLISLMMLGEEDAARKLQRTAEKYQLSQIAAVKLAEDAIIFANNNNNNMINKQKQQHAFTLESYILNARKELQKNSDAFSWQLQVLVSDN